MCMLGVLRIKKVDNLTVYICNICFKLPISSIDFDWNKTYLVVSSDWGQSLSFRKTVWSEFFCKLVFLVNVGVVVNVNVELFRRFLPNVEFRARRHHHLGRVVLGHVRALLHKDGIKSCHHRSDILFQMLR